MPQAKIGIIGGTRLYEIEGMTDKIKTGVI